MDALLHLLVGNQFATSTTPSSVSSTTINLLDYPSDLTDTLMKFIFLTLQTSNRSQIKSTMSAHLFPFQTSQPLPSSQSSSSSSSLSSRLSSRQPLTADEISLAHLLPASEFIASSASISNAVSAHHPVQSSLNQQQSHVALMAVRGLTA